MRLVSLIALSVALVPAPAFAQSADTAAPAAAAADDDHHQHDDEIVVTGVGREARDGGGGI